MLKNMEVPKEESFGLQISWLHKTARWGSLKVPRSPPFLCHVTVPFRCFFHIGLCSDTSMQSLTYMLRTLQTCVVLPRTFCLPSCSTGSKSFARQRAETVLKARGCHGVRPPCLTWSLSEKRKSDEVLRFPRLLGALWIFVEFQSGQGQKGCQGEGGGCS